MNNTIKCKLEKIINEILVTEDIKGIGENDSLGLNSVQFIQLVVEIEKEFDIEFADDDLNLSNFGSLNSLIAYIVNKLD
ncbi:acyl carrier protein [Paenibacillus apiarius]|uniref:Phosphopantetheine-binding protein n=1 Tax=Paenibacillus apiarius TaxID=46240 RepID=A0ABT4DR11_9BACL|nr:phosphopantetheine-binding protein [Paenibacillus apiarius]MCY9512513.1 phosphopantetheine-binding protein [Paenibacillus apiarius]MCY9519784.1 phosphopantetheine-binding protein [Paenibacillus apiarius]MCY9553101.1 phosphopantetheine-binding protein [Paenibacillus apiarius]MCY9559331.1 phosphopantetheine-binding protein [Paenibacillus apiarius]MCY9682690.1 phosphopantetheine-binding protein [Paenibacillus apiarius]